MARIQDWSNSSNVNEKLGCVLLIDELIDDLPQEEASWKITRFANQLSVIISQQAANKSLHIEEKSTGFNPKVQVLELGAKALGRLAQGSPVHTSFFVDFEV